MTELKKVYWDSNIWLGLINGENAKIRAIEYIYESARRGTYEIYTSTISFVEVWRLKTEEKKKKPLPKNDLDAIEVAFEQDFIKLIPVDMEIARNARRLRRQLENFRGAGDAVHLASALRWSVESMLTYDKADLLGLDGKIKDHNGNLLRICEPADPPDGPLFGDGGKP